MIRRIALSAVTVSLVAGAAFAGPAEVVSLVKVSGPSPYGPNGCTVFGSNVNHEGEVSLAVNPTNPENIVATWMQDPLTNFFGASGIVIATSHDSGATWSRQLAPGLTICGPVDAVADPHVSFGPDGTLYLVALGQGPTPTGLWAVSTSTSTDGGLTWTDPIVLGQGANDFPTITAEPDEPGAAFVTWSSRYDVTLMSRTTDGGKTWTSPSLVRVSTPGSIALNRPMASPDGTLAIVITETRQLDLMTAQGPTGPALPGDSESVMVIRSADKGAHWSEPVVLGSRRYDFDNKPTGAVASDGTFYAVWHAPQSDGSLRLVIAKSTDDAATWTIPSIVGVVPEKERFDALAVNGSGVIGLLWYGTSVALGGAQNGLVHFSHSHDGGLSWTDLPLTGSFAMSPWLGDYQELVGLSSGFAAAFVVGAPLAAEGTSDVLYARIGIGNAASKAHKKPKPKPGTGVNH